MANRRNDMANAQRTPKMAAEHKRGGSGIFLLITFIVIMLLFAGFFYFVIRSNVGNFAERNRSVIQNIPLLKLALAKAPDPLDPKYMTDYEIKQKYLEFRDKSRELEEELTIEKAKSDEYKEYKDEFDILNENIEKRANELNRRETDLEKREAYLKELKKNFDELTVKGNEESFREYFEAIDKENADTLYKEIIREQQVDEKIKKFAQIYEIMDAAAAAAIFEQFEEDKIDMVVETLKAMKKENAAAIIESMSQAFAAQITTRLNELFKGN